MRYFVCLLDPSEHGISDQMQLAYERLPRTCGLEFAWHLFDRARVLTAWDERPEEPLVASTEGGVIAGVARLDNRAEIELWLGVEKSGLTDLQLVHRMVIRFGTRRVRDLLGDFAFVTWSPVTRAAVAATDALGLKKLYYAWSSGVLAVASRAEALALDDEYDVQYLTELIGQCTPEAQLTSFAKVRRLPAASVATLSFEKLAVRAYWSPDEFDPQEYRPSMERESPAVLRQLLGESVRYRLSPNGETWAQLSGGLDSSSIVSMAQFLAANGAIPEGLGGTVTFVDLQNTDADEREYSDVVVRRWGIRNETVVDPPFWFDGDTQPPRLDQPSESLPFYPRSERLCSVVWRAGGRALLAGFGGDELLTGSTLFFADGIARGKLLDTAREMARWAARGRMSFWQLAYSNALLPLVPTRFRNSKSVEEGALLPWLASAAATRYGIKQKAFTATGNHGRLGRKYHDAIRESVVAIMSKLDEGVIGEVLDVRCPFLYRPLVEFALRLPPQLCARPHARKWVLREAMNGILPEAIRTRAGKGAPTQVLVRSLSEHRDRLEMLTRHSMLAELGVVDENAFTSAVATAPIEARQDRDLSADVHLTLLVEAWLRIRSGRWPWGHPSSTCGTSQSKSQLLAK
jgi:asparagine synthase (glutamine-hydrolysing)